MTAGLLAPGAPVPGASLPSAVSALETIGLLDPGEAAAAQVEDLSRAHPVCRIRMPDGRRWVVKGGHGAGGVDLAVECLVYRMAVWCSPMRAVLPGAVAVEEDIPLLVLEDVAGVGGGGSLAQQVGLPALFHVQPGAPPEHPELPAIAAELGQVLGALHRATAGFPLPPAPPPLVLLALGPERVPVPGPMAALLAALLLDPVLTAAAEEMSVPVTGCLVHHDLKWDNVVLSGPAGARRPVLLDWEMAGLGDPAWDLGCLLAEHQVRAPEAGLDTAAVALLQTYAQTARPRSTVREVLARRIGIAAALRVAQLALEVANMPICGEPGTSERLVAVARRLLWDLPTTSAEVLRCLS